MKTPICLRWLLTLVLLGANGSFAEATKAKTWHSTPAGAWSATRYQGVVSTDQGALCLAKKIQPYAVEGLPTLGHIWAITEDVQGQLYVAAGNPGMLLRISPQGGVTTLYESKETQVLSLITTPQGEVYAGTGPDGTLLKVVGDKAVVHVQTQELYLWALAYEGKSKALLAATGPHGRILRIDAERQVSVYLQTKQDHVLCLATGADGTVYAGTDRGGLVYQIERAGKGFVVHQAPQSEIRCLLWTPEALYVGTSAPTRRRGAVTASATTKTDKTTAATLTSFSRADTVATSTAEATKSGESSALSKDRPRDAELSSPSRAPEAPNSDDNSVWRIGRDGSICEVFREKALLLALAQTASGELLVGTGMDGRLFALREQATENSEIARLEHGQIHAILRRADGSLVLATGDPGQLYRYEDRYLSQGIYYSPVHDAKYVSHWGAIRWRAELPSGTSVRLAVRGGNVSEPDDTWTDWSGELSHPSTSRIALPNCRFLQYRVTLGTQHPEVTPRLYEVVVRYATLNQAPTITQLETPDIDLTPLKEPGKLKLKWTATDANEDDLTYHLYVRKEGWKDWLLLEESWGKTEYDWDTQTLPSGIYQVRLVASDRPDNDDATALTAERISKPILVANTPPKVQVKVVGHVQDTVQFEVLAVDDWARLTSAAYAIDGKRWVPLLPSDGIFDGKTKTFRFRSDALKPGTHVVMVRVRNAAGQVGTGDIVFSLHPRD